MNKDEVNKLLKWEHESEDEMWLDFIGADYGHKPPEKLNSIKEDKTRHASNLLKLLKLDQDSIVPDLGSGIGFIAEFIADHVKHIHCADISGTFLNECKKNLKDKKNVDFHLIEYGNLDSLKNKSIKFVYAQAVFIHFNLFDMYIYLKAVYNLLPSGGQFLFDYSEIKYVDFSKESYFMKTLNLYLNDRI